MLDKADINCSREIQPGDAVSHAVSGVPMVQKHNELGFTHLAVAQFSQPQLQTCKKGSRMCRDEQPHKIVY